MRRPLIDAVRAFTTSMLGEFDRDVLLDELVHQLAAVVDGTGAGIMMPDRDGALRFAGATDERVELVEQEQALMRRGACFEAFTTGRVIAIEDLRREPRWPEYRELCEDVGFRGVLGVPVTANDGTSIAVINLYREGPAPWSRQDIEVALVLGAMGIAYVVTTGRRERAEEVGQQTQAAVDARAEIERAKGFVMASTGCDARAAATKLRALAAERDEKVRDVAQRVTSDGWPLP